MAGSSLAGRPVSAGRPATPLSPQAQDLDADDDDVGAGASSWAAQLGACSLQLLRFAFLTTVPCESPEAEKAYRTWWIQRFLPVARTAMYLLPPLTFVLFFVYGLVGTQVENNYALNILWPCFGAGVLALGSYALCANLIPDRHWTMLRLSYAGASAHIVLLLAFLLAGLNNSNPDSTPVFFMAGLFVLSTSGAGFGHTPRTSWLLIGAPWIWGVLSIGYAIINAPDQISLNAPGAAPGNATAALPSNATAAALGLAGTGPAQTVAYTATASLPPFTLHQILLFLLLQWLVYSARQFVWQQDTAHRGQLKAMRQLAAEERQLDDVLALLLPPSVAAALKGADGDSRFAEEFESASVLFVEIVGFGVLSAEMEPEALVQLLNGVFSAFDRVVTDEDVFKVETVGPVYMVAAGLPTFRVDHAEALCRVAARVVAAAATFDALGTPMQVKMGMHTGHVIGGVIGEKLPRYRLFGDTVNTAARMETNSLPGRLQLSEETAKCLAATGSRARICERGVLQIKGKGAMRTWWLEEDQATPKDASTALDSSPRLPRTPRPLSPQPSAGQAAIAALLADAPASLAEEAAPTPVAHQTASVAPLPPPDLPILSRQPTDGGDEPSRPLGFLALAVGRHRPRGASRASDSRRRISLRSASQTQSMTRSRTESLTESLGSGSLASSGSFSVGSVGGVARSPALLAAADRAVMHPVTLQFGDTALERCYLEAFLAGSVGQAAFNVARTYVFSLTVCVWFGLNAPTVVFTSGSISNALEVLAICLTSTTAFALAVLLALGLLTASAWRQRPPLWLLRSVGVILSLWYLSAGLFFSLFARLLNELRWTGAFGLIYILSYEVYLLQPVSALLSSAVACSMMLVHFLLIGAFSLGDVYLGASSQLWTIDYPTLVAAVIVPGYILLYVAARQLEAYRRGDFLMEMQSQSRRNAAQGLVSNMLPAPVVRKLARNLGRDAKRQRIVAWRFDTVLLLQSDIVSFTALGARITPEQLCGMLHDLFSAFDRIAGELGVYKIETIGDAFLCATRVVEGESEEPVAAGAAKLATMAVRMQAFCGTFFAPDGSAVRQRIGLHAAGAVAGVVGTAMLRYHVFGPLTGDVTTLEQCCAAGRVRLSQRFAAALGPGSAFGLEPAEPLALHDGLESTWHLASVGDPAEGGAPQSPH